MSRGLPPSGRRRPRDPGGVDRRAFLRATSGAAGLWIAGRWIPLGGGALQDNEYARVIPADKKLDPEWLRSLREPGTPTIVRGDALEKVGMPVGGLFAGQLYLSGDGRLWLWDLFNRYTRGVAGRGQDGENYVRPLLASEHLPIRQGFALRVKTGDRWEARSLDRAGFPGTEFRGEYPIGNVSYVDPKYPIEARLEAFSPFVPLDLARSSFPATILRYTLRNRSAAPAAVELLGFVENPVCLESASVGDARLRNRVRTGPEGLFLGCSAVPRPTPAVAKREPLVFADRAAAKGWKDAGGAPPRIVSPAFTIAFPHINFRIGGAKPPARARIELRVDGKVVRADSEAGGDGPDWASWEVSDLQGKTATIEVSDESGSPRERVEEIELSELPRRPRRAAPLAERSDYGTLVLLLLGSGGDRARAAMPPNASGEAAFEALEAVEDHVAESDGARPVGAIGRAALLAPGEEWQSTFVLAWHFPNLRLPDFEKPVGRHYASTFPHASAVADAVVGRLPELVSQTQLWRDTWYDSTLPRWLLDRTLANASTLATSTAHRFFDGRFWGWEGVGCCPGTCTHVWHYAWAVNRLFPEMERWLREKVDLGIAFDPKSGSIGMRGELDRTAAVDGQAGSILRAWRDHCMSEDAEYLRRNWERIRKAIGWLMAKDPDRDGILEGAQANTLDAEWYGRISWLSSLYVAALRAGEAMAREQGDAPFAEECRAIAERGTKNLENQLWGGEWFVQAPDPAHADAIGADSGCLVDQILGQSWAWQAGLPRVVGAERARAALASLWKHNFTKDVGPFRAAFPEGRPYAVAGEGGLVLCTWPKGGKRADWKKHWQYGYFNECMSGFEHQAAAHMIWEGLVDEGLAVERTIHDRYAAARRNPYNEIECGDHYARAMASYGVFLAVCGFEQHGPSGMLGFAPRIRPEAFRAAFTAAEGWGAIAQTREEAQQSSSVTVRRGRVRVATLRLRIPPGKGVARSEARVGREEIRHARTVEGDRVVIALEDSRVLLRDDTLTARLIFG